MEIKTEKESNGTTIGFEKECWKMAEAEMLCKDLSGIRFVEIQFFGKIMLF